MEIALGCEGLELPLTAQRFTFKEFTLATAAVRPEPQQKISAGYTRVPNSFIENLHLLKLPASEKLALITMRQDQDERPNARKSVSDRQWEDWTGLKSRAKELAVKELQGFGLCIVGRGDTAKFSWDWDRYNQAIRERHQGEYDPKRAEREKRAVTAKIGAKVHEECHDNGCAMLRAGQCPGDAPQSTAEVATGSKPATRLFLTQVAQPVAQTVERATEKAWAATMAALCSFFPLVAVNFLVRFLSMVRAIFPDVTDLELAQAVRMAHIPNQRSEGLFLPSHSTRVISALRLIRRGPPGDHPAKFEPSAPDDALTRCASAIRKRGLHDVAEQIAALSGNHLEIEVALEGIESRTLRAMVATLTDDQRAQIREAAANDLACMGGAGKFTEDQAGELKAKFFARHARALLKLPRISLMEY